ncbi:hypothetical protein [Pseudomonas fluorescens]|uniref:hypothetical protein n=1 Tax=Pseudomonas fluorescens TaxID=294 RepID=UPI001BE951D3|nr:hypothetical protein [Pseudomonas fluorescens]MBT2375396.1 hypothetical protein [Pseudomonas fluorescens]
MTPLHLRPATTTTVPLTVRLRAAQTLSPLARGYQQCRDLSDSTCAMAQLAEELLVFAHQRVINATQGEANTKALNAHAVKLGDLSAMAKATKQDGINLFREVAALLSRQIQGGPALTPYEETLYFDKLGYWCHTASNIYKDLHKLSSTVINTLQKGKLSSVAELAEALCAGIRNTAGKNGHIPINGYAQTTLRAAASEVWNGPEPSQYDPRPGALADNLIHALP